MSNQATETRPHRLNLFSLGLLLVTSCGGGPGVEAELELVDSAFRSVLSGHDHDDLTAEGLPMVSGSVSDEISEANENMDFIKKERHTSENHLDECKFSSSFDRVRARYTALLAALNPNAFHQPDAVRLFGYILHTMQDFMAHSNWIENGQTAVINKGGFLPPPVVPGSKLGDLIVVQKGMPSAFQVGRNGTTGIASRQINVFDSGVYIGRGLITGEYPDNEGESECPRGAQIFHGSSFDQTAPTPFQQGATQNYLAKDDPDSFMHGEAVGIAIRQTTEEFCRLDRMVLLHYGEPGAANFRSKWGIDATKRIQACPDNQGIVTSTWLAALN